MLTGSVAWDWINGLRLLSLDFGRPVYRHLGVDVECEETLRGLTRDTLLGRHSPQGEAFTVGAFDDPESTYSFWIAPYLSALDRALGPNDRRRVEHWVKYVACTEQHNPWVLYEDLLSSWASNFRKTGVDRIGFLTNAGTIARELASANELSREKAVLSEQRVRPLTDWDTRFFNEQDLREIPEGSNFFPFVDPLILAIWMSRFQRFWLWMLAFIEPSDLERIGVAALARSSNAGSYYCAPNELDLPS
jgi:hypothetical protein